MYEVVVIFVESPKDLEMANTCRDFFTFNGIPCVVHYCGFTGCLAKDVPEKYLTICLSRSCYILKKSSNIIAVPRKLGNTLKYLFKRKFIGTISDSKRRILISMDEVEKYKSHPLLIILHELLHIERVEHCPNRLCLGSDGVKLCTNCRELLKEILEKHFKRREECPLTIGIVAI